MEILQRKVLVSSRKNVVKKESFKAAKKDLITEVRVKREDMKGCEPKENKETMIEANMRNHYNTIQKDDKTRSKNQYFRFKGDEAIPIHVDHRGLKEALRRVSNEKKERQLS